LEDALQRKGEHLNYDKVNMTFNLDRGLEGLLFTPEGAFVLQPVQWSLGSDLFSLFEEKEVAYVG
jgi:hypothetical protein